MVSNSKKRIASGDLRQKASKTQIVLPKDLQEDANRSNQLEGTGVDRRILEDQVQLEEENQGDDRPRVDAAPSQLTLTSGISEEHRAMIARKREEAMTIAIQKKKAKEEAIKKKKDREEGEPVEYEFHKKQKSKQREIVRACVGKTRDCGSRGSGTSGLN